MSCGTSMRSSAANQTAVNTLECLARDVGRWCKPLESTAAWQRIFHPAVFFSNESGEIRRNGMTCLNNLMCTSSDKIEQ